MSNTHEKFHVLLVEDTDLYIKLVESILHQIPNVVVHSAKNMQEGINLLDHGKVCFDLALIDLSLPDAPQGAFVDETYKRRLSSIVFSGVMDPELKLTLFEKGIIDFIAKGSPVALHYLKEIVTFISLQSGKKVLIANADWASRNQQVRMLEHLKMNVSTCDTGQEAMDYMAQNPDTTLAIVSENIQNFNPLKLVNNLRKRAAPSKLAIVAIPNKGADEASEYLRNGANDFLHAPYSQEEFQCRIRNAVQLQQQMQALEVSASYDYLTRLLNRRAFFQTCRPVVAAAKRRQASIALMMMDIDHFKAINDTYGHDVGDDVLQEVARILKKEIRDTDILARFGGEEFILLMPEISEEQVPDACMRIQRALKTCTYGNSELPQSPTLSFGICTNTEKTIEEMITEADQALYKAKEAGRNRYMIA